MRAIVMVEWGARRWRRAVIPPGGKIRVGRFETADLVVPEDEALSGLHVEISWDGARGLARDLGSPTGTFVNGERAAEGELGHGDWLRAGDSVFSFYVEGLVSPWAPPRGSPLVPAERRGAALVALRAEAAPLYAVLDAARSARIDALLRASAEESQSLYEGTEGEDLAEVAPYLVRLPAGSWLLERLVEEGWERGWGIFLTCRRPFQEVRRHLRRLLVIDVKETSEQLYFRFYDPRVLSRSLQVANPRQRQQLFGPVEAYLLEGKEGGSPMEVQRSEL